MSVRESAWAESVAAASAVADRDKPAAAQIVRSSAHPTLVAEGLLHLISAMFTFPDADPQKLLETCRRQKTPPPVPNLYGR